MTTSIKNQFDHSFFKALLHHNEIIEIVWSESVSIVEIIHLKKVHEAIIELGKGKRMRIHFSTHGFVNVGEEASKYAISKEFTAHSLAHAVLVDSLSLRISMNFFNQIHKPIIPTKGFSDKKAAFEWLLKIKQSS